MKATFISTFILWFLIVVTSAVPVDQRSSGQVSVVDEPTPLGEYNDTDILAENQVIIEEASNEAGSDETDHLDDLPEDRQVDDISSLKNNEDNNPNDLPDGEKKITDQPETLVESSHSSLINETDRNIDTSLNKTIPTVAHFINFKSRVVEDTTNTQETIFESERQHDPKTNPRHKRYVKKSKISTTDPPTTTTRKKTYTRRISSSTPAKNTNASPTRQDVPSSSVPRKRYIPRGGANSTLQPRGPVKTPQPRGLRKLSSPNDPNNARSRGGTERPSSSTPRSTSNKIGPTNTRPQSGTHPSKITRGGNKTCRCRIVSKPKMECYSFTNEATGQCKLRMCGAKWECLTSGYSNNICIRKFGTEKIEGIAGTNRCVRRKHAQTSYWVFYKKYTGSLV